MTFVRLPIPSALRAAVRAAVLALAAGALPAAALAQADPAAILRIGSLYEPQNLDNTAGAGQGINEAFNDNVYEALFRLTEANLALGLPEEAMRSAAVLGSNFPGSKWYERAYDLMRRHAPNVQVTGSQPAQPATPGA